MTHEQIAKDIRGYALFERLYERCQIVIDGGCARSTVYKALSKGPVTDSLEKIIETAATLIAEHKSKIDQMVAA